MRLTGLKAGVSRSALIGGSTGEMWRESRLPFARAIGTRAACAVGWVVSYSTYMEGKRRQMDGATVRALLEKHGLGRHAEALLALAAPTIRVYERLRRTRTSL